MSKQMNGGGAINAAPAEYSPNRNENGADVTDDGRPRKPRPPRTDREIDQHKLLAYVGGSIDIEERFKRHRLATDAGLRPEHFTGQYADAYYEVFHDRALIDEMLYVMTPRPYIETDEEAIVVIEKLKQPTAPPPLPADRMVHTVAARARWYGQVAADVETKRITTLDYFIGVQIGNRVNLKTGTAFPGYEYLAKKAAVTTRSVQESVRTLESRGHVRTSRDRAASRLTIFTPMLKTT
jgi:hypothetical protein